MIHISQAILSLRPGASFTIEGEQKYENIVWNSTNTNKPSKIEVTNELERLQAEWNSTKYQRSRQPEYPPLADLADALYWQSKGNDIKMAAYLAAVDAVKTKYPKPEGL
jgi:hypothetical protein